MTSFADLKPRTQQRGVPNLAVLLTWFMPGAGHLYLGRVGLGVFAFIVVQGLYLLGLYLSDGMGFEFLQAELRSSMAPALAPELGNLGALLYHYDAYGFGVGYPREFPPSVALGAMLTAISGITNLALMCHAYFEAQMPKDQVSGKSNPGFAVLLAWAVPGLGHIYQGRRLRGILVFVSLVGCMLLGTWLAEGSNLSRERHYYYWGGQLLGGLPAVGLQFLWGAKLVTTQIPYGEAGLVFGSVAGLLNILMMLDVCRGVTKSVSQADIEGEKLAPSGQISKEATS
jgi:TM2 domain-containing membrane protein YozV